MFSKPRQEKEQRSGELLIFLEMPVSAKASSLRWAVELVSLPLTSEQGLLETHTEDPFRTVWWFRNEGVPSEETLVSV